MSDRDPISSPDHHEQEFEFMVAERRRTLAGLWAAELLGLIGQAAHDYAIRLRNIRRAQRTDDDGDVLVEELHKDLGEKASHHEIREKVSHFLHEARRQLLHEKKKPD